MTPSRSFETFLETIHCWLALARDEEVAALLRLVDAEQRRRGLPVPGAQTEGPKADEA